MRIRDWWRLLWIRGESATSRPLLLGFPVLFYVVAQWLACGTCRAYVCDRFVQTDMGTFGAKKVGLEEAYTPTDVCCAGMVKVIDEATREETSGTFAGWNGVPNTW